MKKNKLILKILLLSVLFVSFNVKSFATVVDPSISNYVFKENLSIGSNNEDVRLLQKFLNQNGFFVSSRGLGSLNNESNYFGIKTKNAVFKLQNKFKFEIGLKKSNGEFDELTREFINKQIAKKEDNNLIPANDISKEKNNLGPIEVIPEGNVSDFYVGGIVSGLNGNLVLQNNGREVLNITSNGNFKFKNLLKEGESYIVQVSSQPNNQKQECTLLNNKGFVYKSDIDNILINCVNTQSRLRHRNAQSTYTIGGTVAGLTSNGLVIQNNGGDNLSIPAASSNFTFSTRLVNGATYLVTVLSQALNDSCSVTNNTGTVSGSNITNISIVCLSNA